MTRYLRSLASFVVLTFAIVITPVAAQNVTLTAELLSRMLNFIAREGIDKDVPASLANSLGLSAAGQGWPSRQVATTEKVSGVLHGMTIGRVSDKDILFNLNTKERINVYRLRRDGMLVAAVSFDPRTRQFAPFTGSEVQKGLEAELFYWSREKLLE